MQGLMLLINHHTRRTISRVTALLVSKQVTERPLIAKAGTVTSKVASKITLVVSKVVVSKVVTLASRMTSAITTEQCQMQMHLAMGTATM